MAIPPDNQKSQLLRRSLPPVLDTRFSPSFVSNLSRYTLGIGTSDNLIGGKPTDGSLSDIQKAKASIMEDSAEGDYLTRLGHNVGIVRPPMAPNSDDIYRGVIELLGWLPKCINFAVYKLLEVIFGSQADLIKAGQRPWRVYEVNPNEIIIEIPFALTGGSNENASYLHGFFGRCSSTSALLALPVVTVVGDMTSEYLQPPGGLSFQYDSGSGSYTQLLINSWSYNSGTNLTTINLNGNFPANKNGVRFFVLIPGDGVNSFTGDFMPQDASVIADTATTPSHTDFVYLGGEGKLEIYQFYMDLIVRAAGIVVRYERI